MNFGVLKFSNLVKIGKRTKRVSLQRFLCTKVVLEPGRINEADMTCLFENQLWLERKCFKDRNFFEKYKDKVFTLSKILKEVDLRGFNQSSSLKRFSEKLQSSLDDFLVPARNYGQWKSRFSGCFQFNPLTLNKELGDFYLTKKLPPKRSMGIGYRDKGSRRNLAIDGSPDWREVSSAFPEEWWEKEIENAESVEDIEWTFFRLFHKEYRHAFERDTSVSADSTETTKREETKGEGE
jgi:hypothetical protein